MKPQTSAYAHGLAAVLLWSTVATAFKLALRHLTPPLLLLYATATSTAVLLGMLAARGQARLLLRGSPGDYLRSALLGLLNPFLYYLVLFWAYDLLPAQQAQPLNYTWAITLTLLSIPLLGQRPSARDLAAVVVSYLGVVIIATEGAPLSLRFQSPLGVALALGSTIIWALYWIYNTRDRRDPVAALCLSFIFGLVYIVIAAPWLGGLRLPDLAGLAGAVYIGVFEMGVTFVLWLKAMRLTRSTARVSNLIFISPFLSLVLIHLLLGETIRGSTVVGLIFIIGGIALQQLGAPR